MTLKRRQEGNGCDGDGDDGHDNDGAVSNNDHAYGCGVTVGGAKYCFSSVCDDDNHDDVHFRQW